MLLCSSCDFAVLSFARVVVLTATVNLREKDSRLQVIYYLHEHFFLPEAHLKKLRNAVSSSLILR
uniref:Uncharacterized protein n=1 Tax=Romanomermis culicivorax TaxID=13658 RepID=A0A915J9G1_ROMCU